MPALTQSQIQALPDVLASDRFTINFGSIPGYGDTYNNLTLKCLDCVIAGTGNEHFQVPLGNVMRNFRGKKMYQRQMSVTFAETVDASTVAALRQWNEQVVGTNSGNSQGYIASYAVTAVVSVYDTTGAVADTATFYNCFIADMQDYNLDTSTSQPVRVQALFVYDYVVYGNTTIL
jgi:hypothetical protein